MGSTVATIAATENPGFEPRSCVATKHPVITRLATFHWWTTSSSDTLNTSSCENLSDPQVTFKNLY